MGTDATLDTDGSSSMCGSVYSLEERQGGPSTRPRTCRWVGAGPGLGCRVVRALPGATFPRAVRG